MTSHATRASAYVSICLKDSVLLRFTCASSASGAMYRYVPTCESDKQGNASLHRWFAHRTHEYTYTCSHTVTKCTHVCIVTVHTCTHNSMLIHARHLVHKHNTVEFNNLPPNTVCARPPMCTCAYARSLPALSWRVPTASGL